MKYFLLFIIVFANAVAFGYAMEATHFAAGARFGIGMVEGCGVTLIAMRFLRIF